MMKGKLLRIVSPVLVLALVFSLVSVFLMPKPAAAQPAEVWVDDDYCELCYNDGHTWGVDAFRNIQDGIDAVASPGIVHVADGDYEENIVLKDGVQVLGAGATIDGRGAGSVVTAIGVGPDTVLDGFTIFNGTADYGGGMNNTDSSPMVTLCTFHNNTASLWGGGMYNAGGSPTVTNCTFSSNDAHDGGGMFNYGSSPMVTNCTFDNNTASLWGGGMCNQLGSSPTVANCIFDHNSAAWGGGGMCNSDYSSPTVTNCTFDNNTASFWGGGGMCNSEHSSPTVANCTFSSNSADFGGGMHNYGSSPMVTDCIFYNNSATDNGGGMHNSHSSPTISNNIFQNNSAGLNGGGIDVYDHSSPTIVKNIIHGNVASGAGGIAVRAYSSPTIVKNVISQNSATGSSAGGISVYTSSPTIANNVISGNSAGWEGGGIYILGDCSPTLTNNAIVSNTAPSSGGGVWASGDSSPTIVNCIIWGNGDDLDGCMATYSDIEDGDPGEGNIAADPMFFDPVGGDYRLQAGSPCIDAGSNAAVPGWLTTDFEGNPRILDGDGDGEAIVDMGAYEYVFWTCIFQDPARGTELRVSPGDKIFQFIAPDSYDSGVVAADHMIVCQARRVQLILICHSDSEISLFAFAVGCENGFCIALARDMETGQTYFLFT